MLRAEIAHTCSNHAVAGAALRSIGDRFHSRIADLAKARNLGADAFAAALVKQFAENAGEDDWRRLDLAIARSDMPVLTGFRHIVETMIKEKARCAL